jgi:Na+/H+-translocating membrane pyrophosphatase
MQIAISSSNSGGALDNAKKFVEGNKINQVQDEEIMKAHYEAAVVGDTVGDPLKDTTGPSLNIILKLSAIISLMFGHLFVEFSLWKF